MPQFLMVARGVNISDAQVIPTGSLRDLSKQLLATITCNQHFKCEYSVRLVS